mgnify:CR=1 FL=1
MLAEKCKVAVFVSGGGTNLQAILDSRGEIIKNAEIYLVASSSKGAYALERAKKHDIETFIIEDEQRLVEKLKSLEIDFIVLAGYLRILSEDFCKRYSNRIINTSHRTSFQVFKNKSTLTSASNFLFSVRKEISPKWILFIKDFNLF